MKVYMTAIAALLIASPVLADNCPSTVISNTRLSKSEKETLELKGITSRKSVLDESGHNTMINYSVGQRILVFRIEDAENENRPYKTKAVVELLEVTQAEKVEIAKEDSPLALIPSSTKRVGGVETLSDDSRKSLNEHIRTLRTCSF